MKELFSDLCRYTAEDLANSERIAQAIGAIRESGYDIFLILEPCHKFVQHSTSTGDPHFTENNMRLAKSLKIILDVESNSSEGT